MLLIAVLVVAVFMGCSQHSPQYTNALKYIETGHYSNAEAELIRGIKLSPDDTELYALLVTAYLKQGKYELAVDTYKRYYMMGVGYGDYSQPRIWRPRADAVYGFLKANYELAGKFYARRDYMQAHGYQNTVANALIAASTVVDSEKEGIARFSVEIDPIQFLLRAAETIKCLGISDEADRYYINRYYREVLKRDPKNEAARIGLSQIGEKPESREE
jgi:hypothetical protein